MTSGAKLFYSLAVFFLVMDVLYILGTKYLAETNRVMGTEWAGVTGFSLALLLSLMLSVYLHITDNKTDIGPSDWEMAEIEDGAGVLGFFSAGSIWPFQLTIAVMLVAYGLAFAHLWLIVAGVIFLIWGSVMMNLQYGVARDDH